MDHIEELGTIQAAEWKAGGRDWDNGVSILPTSKSNTRAHEEGQQDIG